MNLRLNACLILGCNGFKSEDGFQHCNSIYNVILDMDTLDQNEYNEIINFLDQACDLFSSPMYDYNKCTNALSLLYKNYKVFDIKKLHNIQAFLKNHKTCGIWIMLLLKEDL